MPAREETPPPRRRAEDKACVWSARQLPDGHPSDWSSTPVAYNGQKRQGALEIEEGEDSCSSPRASLVVKESAAFQSPKRGGAIKGICFSSPKQDSRSRKEEEEQSFLSPKPTRSRADCGKENMKPGTQALVVALQTPLRTPARLTTVHEHDGHQVENTEAVPAWVQTPTLQADIAALLSSPAPPGLEALQRFQAPTVKNTFYCFESPFRERYAVKSPNTVPPNFAPLKHLLTEPADAEATLLQTPLCWLQHDLLPIFPEPPAECPPMPSCADMVKEPDTKACTTTIVRLSDFFPQFEDQTLQHQQAQQPAVVQQQAPYQPQMPQAQVPQQQYQPYLSAQTPMSTQPLQMDSQYPFSFQSLQQPMQFPPMQAPSPWNSIQQQQEALMQQWQQLQQLQQLIQQLPLTSMTMPTMPQQSNGFQPFAPQPTNVVLPSVLCPSTCHMSGICRCGDLSGVQDLYSTLGAAATAATAASAAAAAAAVAARAGGMSAWSQTVPAPVLPGGGQTISILAEMFPEMGASSAPSS